MRDGHRGRGHDRDHVCEHVRLFRVYVYAFCYCHVYASALQLSACDHDRACEHVHLYHVYAHDYLLLHAYVHARSVRACVCEQRRGLIPRLYDQRGRDF